MAKRGDGFRRNRTQEVAGSSPASSIHEHCYDRVLRVLRRPSGPAIFAQIRVRSATEMSESGRSRGAGAGNEPRTAKRSSSCRLRVQVPSPIDCLTQVPPMRYESASVDGSTNAGKGDVSRLELPFLDSG